MSDRSSRDGGHVGASVHPGSEQWNLSAPFPSGAPEPGTVGPAALLPSTSPCCLGDPTAFLTFTRCSCDFRAGIRAGWGTPVSPGHLDPPHQREDG